MTPIRLFSFLAYYLLFCKNEIHNLKNRYYEKRTNWNNYGEYFPRD